MTQVILERPFINIVNLIWSFDRSTNQVYLLLLKRAHTPCQGRWALPETYLRSEESADQAALRLVREKIGLDLSAVHTEQLATFTHPKRAPGAKGQSRTLSLAYMTFLPEMPPLKAGYGASDAKWFSFSFNQAGYCLQNGKLAFEAALSLTEEQYYQRAPKVAADPTHLAFDHEWIFKVASLRIRNKLDYQPNILLILGNEFTLKEARSVYASFLMTKLEAIDNSNFKKTHGHLFEEIGTANQQRPGRPAKLFRLHKTT